MTVAPALQVVSSAALSQPYRDRIKGESLVHYNLIITREENGDTKLNQEELLIFLFFPPVTLNHIFSL